ncbi:MAG: MerR family transcriptional regulator [Lachnospiraceae bacterium]|nr:MerR family transcriptional regulator [Lachnospiraceae bacterium]
MMTVNEVSKLSGVSVRTLHYYDQIGLLSPSDMTDSGYRLYDEEAMERLQLILLFRELEFPLKDIAAILNSSDFDRNRALEQQIELLTLKKEHIENLLLFARGIHGIGVKNMDFSAFDAKKLDEYAAQAKATWGQTEAFKEFEAKNRSKSKNQQHQEGVLMMKLFEEFGQMLDSTPESEEVQAQVKKLQDYITEHFYTCTKEILSGLGKMYAGGGSMTENIDKAGGLGTAAFVNEAIQIYCSKG